MHHKGLIGLVAVAVVAVGAAVAVSGRGGGGASDPQQGEPVLPDLARRLGDVGRLGLVHGENRMTLVRKDKDWVLEEKGEYPADPQKLRQALLGLAELRLVEPKTAKAEFYPRLELEDAGKKDAKSTLVTVADDKGAMLGELIVGKRRVDQLGGGSDGIYVRKPGNAQSWLARGTLDLSGDTAQWLERKVIDLPEKEVKEAVLTQPDGEKIDIVRDKPEEKPKLADLPADKKLKSESVLVEPAGALANLELTDVRAAKDFDFPATGVAKAAYTTFDGLKVTVELAEKDATNWLRFKAEGSGDAEAKAKDLNARLGNWVYAVAPYKANALKTKLADVLEAPKGS
jgi:hypothetical protein